jgi:hypothetical protein
MILLLLKVTILLMATLAATAAIRRSSAALRHLLCACGLGGALLMAITLYTPTGPAVLRFTAFSATSMARTVPSIPTAVRLLPWIWLAGSVLLLARLAFGYLRVAKLVRSAGPAFEGALLADVSVPVVTGLLRPAILLPRAAAQWPPEQLEAALRHERTHLLRSTRSSGWSALN